MGTRGENWRLILRWYIDLVEKEKRQEQKSSQLQAAVHNDHTPASDAGGSNGMAEKLAAVSAGENHAIRHTDNRQQVTSV